MTIRAISGAFLETETKVAMTHNDRTIDDLRRRIPSFVCVVGCHDCCGPVTASSEEMARLPVKSEAEHDRALAELSCPHLGQHGCEVYAERPLICRLFGTTPSLACPLLPGRCCKPLRQAATFPQPARQRRNTPSPSDHGG